MAYCSKCGAQIADNAAFCPSCGASTGSAQSNPYDFSEKVSALNDTPDTTWEYDPQDIAANKGVSVLAYLSWLVIIPLLVAKDSKFARFHCNQGLVLAIIEICWTVAHGVISGILSVFTPLRFVSAILSLVSIGFLVLAIIGIVNVANGKAKELPIIGKIRIIK